MEPKAKSLQQLPQKIDQYTLLLFKVFYNTKAEAEGGRLDSILCNEDDFIVDSNRVSIERTVSDVAAVMKSGILLPPSSCYSLCYATIHSPDFCECRNVLQALPIGSGGSGGDMSLDQCSLDLDIQEICSGTVASPCNCTSPGCQVLYTVKTLSLF